MTRTGIVDRVRQWVIDIPLTLRARLGRSPRARAFVYRLRNAYVFSDLAQHDRMLHDRHRVDAYHRAIGRYINAGDVVVDLGTGSGVLAFFAARRGARVHAIEHGQIIESARAIAEDNGIRGVTFHRMHSRKFTTGDRIDAIIHEQIGDALFDEQVVANIADLRDRVLKPGGAIHPAHLSLYIEPIQLSDEARVPFAWQKRLYGIDFRRLQDLDAKQPLSYRLRFLSGAPFERYLCTLDPVVTVDLATAQPDQLPRTISYEREVVTAGTHDGFSVFFIAAFDEEITFSNRPDGGWTSWGMPFLRVQSRRVLPGDRISLDLTAGSLAEPNTWKW